MVGSVLASWLLFGACPIAVESAEPVVVRAAANLKTTLERLERDGVESLKGVNRIVIGVKPEPNALTARVAVSADEVRLTGATPREAMQACYRFEDELAALGGRPLKTGERTYTRMFSPRMVHSGCEIDRFPDAHMDEIARAGMDAILVYIREPPDVTRSGKADLNDLVCRAAEHGLDVYAYYDRWSRHLEKHPLDPGAEDYYDRMIGSIVKNAPGIRGLVCVGESCGFPRRGGADAGFNTGRPVMDWVPWLEMVTRVTRKYNPDFEILFWTYNWARAPEKDRRALLEAVPTNVTVLVTFELGSPAEKRHGVTMSVEDYSISVPGPSPTFTNEAAIVGARGMKLVTMSNTAGRTWDFGGLPYEPVPFLWLERFRALRTARQAYGLTGLMDSHHFGFQPNLCADIAKLAFTREVSDEALEKSIGEAVRRRFGEGDAPAVLAALRDWSEAMDRHPAASVDQWGVWRVGSTYPFVPMGEKIPPAPPCLGTGRGWKFVDPVAGQAWGWGFTPGELPGHIALSKGEMELWKSGSDRLAALKGEEARRLAGLGRFCEHAARTRYNLHRYWKACADGRPKEELCRILDEEAENVRTLIPVVEANPKLGWEPRMGFVTNADCLRWKLTQLEQARERTKQGRKKGR